MDKLTNLIVFTLAILGGLYIGIVVVSAINDNDDTYTPPHVSAPQQVVQPEFLTQYERETFVAGCTAEGASLQDCQCMLGHLEVNNSASQIRQMEAKIGADPNYIPAEVYEAAIFCAGGSL